MKAREIEIISPEDGVRNGVSIDSRPQLRASLASGGPDPETILILAESGDDPGGLALAALQFLPLADAYLLRTRYLLGFSQNRIAARLNITQQAVSDRLAKAIKRLRFVLELRTFDRDAARIARELALLPRAKVTLAIALWGHHFSQSATAEALGESAMTVRAGVRGLLVALDEAAPQALVVKPYAQDLAHIIARRAWWLGVGHARSRWPKWPGFELARAGR